MSKYIHTVIIDPSNEVVFIYASRGGVEISSLINFTLDPITARVYAANLIAAADEVERMRKLND